MGLINMHLLPYSLVGGLFWWDICWGFCWLLVILHSSDHCSKQKTPSFFGPVVYIVNWSDWLEGISRNNPSHISTLCTLVSIYSSPLNLWMNMIHTSSAFRVVHTFCFVTVICLCWHVCVSGEEHSYTRHLWKVSVSSLCAVFGFITLHSKNFISNVENLFKESQYTFDGGVNLHNDQ